MGVAHHSSAGIEPEPHQLVTPICFAWCPVPSSKREKRRKKEESKNLEKKNREREKGQEHRVKKPNKGVE